MKLPYHSITFGTDGRPTGTGLLQETVDFVTAQAKAGVTDLLVLAHGWNNSLAQAQSRYDRLCDHVEELRAARGHPAGRLAVVGLIWPSLQWADDDAAAGGALSVGGSPLDALKSRIAEAVDDPESAAALRKLAPDLATSSAARAGFVDELRKLLPPPHEVDDDDPPPSALLDGDPDQLFDATGQAVEDALGATLAGPASPGGVADLPPGVFPTGDGGAAGDATAFGLGSLDLLDKAREVLNSTTYYKMKKRSGLVADKGLVPLLDALAAADGAVRVHLVGHSFGARLVSRAAATTQTTVSSLSLLQGAFSHRAFAADNGASKPAVPGAFRPALSGALTGPAMATHTHNDRAVGVAYAVASRLAQQAGSSLGGPDDVYGGLGANGAVATAEADEAVLGGVRSDYTFTPRRILNLKADATIANHGDVSNEAVANALLQLVLSAT